jgi:hypothetical protein
MNDAWSPNAASAFMLKILPMVEWNKVLNKNQVQLRIDNSYHFYQQMTYDLETLLPEGWRRSTEDRIIHDNSMIFTHPSIQWPGFRYPFPIAADVAAPKMDLYLPILSFRTQKCRMFLGALVEHTVDFFGRSGPCLTVKVRDNTRLRAGVIESLFVSQHEYEKGDPCELVAISKGSLRKREPTGYRGVALFEEVEAFPELKDKELYEFYNVLWIEWEDGIAYRKALGRVMKEAWERQDVE